MAEGIVIRSAHFPGRAPIEAYGNGGFRFADMSHKGSILLLPSGIRAWAVNSVAEMSIETFEPVFSEGSAFELLLLGTGPDIAGIPERLRQLRLRQTALLAPERERRLCCKQIIHLCFAQHLFVAGNRLFGNCRISGVLVRRSKKSVILLA